MFEHFHESICSILTTTCIYTQVATPNPTISFQLFTGAAWDGVITDLTNEEDCYPSDKSVACGSRILGTIYILSYLVISFILILNFHLVIILEYLNHAKIDSNNELSAEEVDEVNKIWLIYDPEFVKYIPKDKLSDFLDALTLVAIRKQKPNQDEIKCLAIPENDNHMLFYGDVVKALQVWKLK